MVDVRSKVRVSWSPLDVSRIIVLLYKNRANKFKLVHIPTLSVPLNFSVKRYIENLCKGPSGSKRYLRNIVMYM